MREKIDKKMKNDEDNIKKKVLRIQSDNPIHREVLELCLLKLKGDTDNRGRFSIDGRYIYDLLITKSRALGPEHEYTEKTANHIKGVIGSTFGFTRKNDPLRYTAKNTSQRDQIVTAIRKFLDGNQVKVQATSVNSKTNEFLKPFEIELVKLSDQDKALDNRITEIMQEKSKLQDRKSRIINMMNTIRDTQNDLDI